METVTSATQASVTGTARRIAPSAVRAPFMAVMLKPARTAAEVTASPTAATRCPGLPRLSNDSSSAPLLCRHASIPSPMKTTSMPATAAANQVIDSESHATLAFAPARSPAHGASAYRSTLAIFPAPCRPLDLIGGQSPEYLRLVRAFGSLGGRWRRGEVGDEHIAARIAVLLPLAPIAEHERLVHGHGDRSHGEPGHDRRIAASDGAGLHRVGYHLRQRKSALLVGGAHALGRGAVRVGIQHDEPDQVAIRRARLEHLGHAHADSLFERRDRWHVRQRPADELIQLFVQGREDIFLRREVEVDRPQGDAGFLRDVRDGRPAKALPREHMARRRKDLLATRGPCALTACLSFGDWRGHVNPAQ